MSCSSTSRPDDEPSLDSLESAALSTVGTTSARIAAIETLYGIDKSLTKYVLLTIAARNNEPIELLKVAGERLARIDHTDVRVTEFDLRDMSKAAFEAYYHWMPPE